MLQFPVWTSCVDLPNFAPMPLGLKTDVLIIGGGMAGILCAYYLKQVGVQCSLVEAKTVCSGVTENTTAKITSQHGLIYHKLLKEFGPEKAKQYYCANEQAVEQYRLLSQRYDFSWEEKNNYVYSRDNFQKLYKELEALQSLKIPAQYQKSLPLPFRVAGAVEFPHQAQMNPLKLVNALLEDLTVYEHTRALEINGSQVVTDRGKIQAEHVIVATHFPFLNLHGSYVLKLYQHRSYVLALEHGPQIGGMYVDEAQTGLSFRNAGTYLLLGGGGHRTGKQNELAAAAGVCRPALSRRPGALPLGGPGLHEPGRRTVYRAVLCQNTQCLCGDWLSKMGHDVVHGGRAAAAGHDFRRRQ